MEKLNNLLVEFGFTYSHDFNMANYGHENHWHKTYFSSLYPSFIFYYNPITFKWIILKNLNEEEKWTGILCDPRLYNYETYLYTLRTRLQMILK